MICATFDLLAESLDFDVNPHRTVGVVLDVGVHDAGARASGWCCCCEWAWAPHNALRLAGRCRGRSVIYRKLAPCCSSTASFRGYGFYVLRARCAVVGSGRSATHQCGTQQLLLDHVRRRHCVRPPHPPSLRSLSPSGLILETLDVRGHSACMYVRTVFPKYSPLSLRLRVE